MSDLYKAITNLTLDMEVYNSYEDRWHNEDQMAFARKIIMEAIMDKLYWLTKGKNKGGKPSGSEGYLTQQQARVKYAQETFRGDEISELRLRGAIANCQAAAAKHEALTDLQNSLHSQYMIQFGEDYMPYGSAPHSNVPVAAESDMPSDIQQMLEALGMAEPANEEKPKKKKAS
jgi:hypothetical protein